MKKSRCKLYSFLKQLIFITLIILLLIYYITLNEGEPVHNVSNLLQTTDENVLCKCPFNNLVDVNNVVILTATGRVGSSNLLDMLGSHSRIDNIGELFISSKYRYSLHLPPNNQSPIKNPASLKVKLLLAAHMQKSFFPEQLRSSSNDGNNHLPSLSGLKLTTLSQSSPRRLASVKFWHAWENGVTVSWMVRHLISCGCVSHFILIARNPVRVTISEQYANRVLAWSYAAQSNNVPINSFKKNKLPLEYKQKHRQNNNRKLKFKTVCDESFLSFHVGGRWLGEMAASHYLGFKEALSVISDHTAGTSRGLGISYEADISESSYKAYFKIVKFLHLYSSFTPSSTSLKGEVAPSVTHTKGMTCNLSSLLINFDELRCSLFRWEKSHAFDRGDKLNERDFNNLWQSGERSNHSDGWLTWMADENDNREVTFEHMISSWGRLRGQLESAEGHIPECAIADILQLEKSQSQLNHLDSSSIELLFYSEAKKGICGVGGETSECHSLTAVPSDGSGLCLMSMRRAGCDAMTFRDGGCYLHKNISDFRLEACSNTSWYHASTRATEV